MTHCTAHSAFRTGAVAWLTVEAGIGTGVWDWRMCAPNKQGVQHHGVQIGPGGRSDRAETEC